VDQPEQLQADEEHRQTPSCLVAPAAPSTSVTGFHCQARSHVSARVIVHAALPLQAKGTIAALRVKETK
jgi:hypothetical protein